MRSACRQKLAKPVRQARAQKVFIFFQKDVLFFLKS